jgi:hypothetical protein
VEATRDDYYLKRSKNKTGYNPIQFENTIKKKIKSIINTILVFLLIFTIHFTFMPTGITMRLLSMGIIVLVWMRRNLPAFHTRDLKINKTLFSWFYACLFIMLYTVSITSINNVPVGSSTLSANTFNFLIMVCVLPYMFMSFFKDAEEFAHSVVNACIVQSVIVYASYINPTVKSFITSLMSNVDDNYLFYTEWRATGLGVAGAGGSIYLTCGLIAAMYIVLFGKQTKSIYIKFFAILIAIFLVGRTGFYVGLLFILYIVISPYKAGKTNKKTKKMLGTIIGLVVALYLILKFSQIDITRYEYLTARSLELFMYGTESSTLKAINNHNTSIPSLSWETFWGTGIIRGTTDSGLVFQNDSGYIKRYAAIGLFGSVISYLTLMIYILKISAVANLPKRTFYLFILFILFIIEYKEPFIYMLSFPFTLIMIILLSNKEKDFEEIKCKGS